MFVHQPPRQEHLSSHYRANSWGHKTELVLLVTNMGAICLAPQDLHPHHKVKYDGQNQSTWLTCKPSGRAAPVAQWQRILARFPQTDSLPRCSGPVHSGWLVGGWQVACPWPLALLRTSPGSPSPSLGQREETPTARLASPHVLLHISPDAISLVQQPNTSSRAGHDPP